MDNKLGCSEFIYWLGLWFIISTSHFDNIRYFWSTNYISAFDGAPYWLNVFISVIRFESILSSFQITNVSPPNCVDRLRGFQKFIDEWNKIKRDNFILGLVSFIFSISLTGLPGPIVCS